ncbi:MAG: MFS transporter [Kiritimatiellales bacterium]
MIHIIEPMQQDHLQQTSIWRPPYIFSLGFAFTNALTWMVALGTPLILLCQQLKATPLEIGLVSSFPFLVLPLQVLTTALLQYLGFKRQMILCWGIRSVFLLIPLGLAIAAPTDPAPWMLPALLMAMLCFTVFRAIGGSATFPWIYAILPNRLRGHYFTTEQVMVGLSGVFTMLLSAWAMHTLTVYAAFTVLFLLAITGSVGAVTCLQKLPDAPAPRDLHITRVLLGVWPLIRTKGPFRSYLLLMLTVSLFNTSTVPFTIYYLRGQTTVGDSWIFLLTGTQVVGSIAMSFIVKHFADRTGARPLLIGSQIIMAMVCLFWGILITGATGLLHLLPLAYLGTGAATNLLTLGNIKYTPQLSNDNDRAFVISVLNSLAGFCGGVAPILWGWFLKDVQTQSINPARFSVFFLCNLIIQLALIPRFARIPEKDPLPRWSLRWVISALGLNDK